MNLKTTFILFFLTISSFIIAEETKINYKLYGFVRNDFFYNSRQNVESIDGLFNLFPKQIELSGGVDKYAIPQAEMLSVASRLGLDISGADILGAKSTGKFEADFAGFSTNFFVLRILNAYVKLNWKKTELLIGQTWHPLCGSLIPTGPSLNIGAPFQPFNRSPQVKLKYNLNNSLSISLAGCYQMQYVSQGPNTTLATNGANSSYIKTALMPDLFLGTEFKTSHWTAGLGFDIKTIKPSVENLTSASLMAYTQFLDTKFQFKAKTMLGQNMTDYVIPCGYGVTDSINGHVGYTNFNMSNSWVNVVYGSKWQVGLLLGYAKNLGTSQHLFAKGGKFTAYGYGVNDQIMVDEIIRIAPHLSYNLSNFKFGVEFDLTSAKYGKLLSTGNVENPSSVSNQRIVASMSYLF